jgi:hypothetical protein
MFGNIGLPGPVVVDSDQAKFGPWTGPFIMKQKSREMSLLSSPSMLSEDFHENQQDRSSLSSEERAMAARCSGILHACSNWMALHSTKMRVVLFKEGRWCTDDDLNSKACYKNGKNIDKVTIPPLYTFPAADEFI